MRSGKKIRAGNDALRKAETDAPAAMTLPPASRPAGLEILRAGLLGCLAREPSVCRSIGLVR
jgi:hypothetical protein